MRWRLGSCCDACRLRDTECGGALDAHGDCATQFRDLVRKLANLADNLLHNYEWRYRDDEPIKELVAEQRAFLREARIAIGEGTK